MISQIPNYPSPKNFAGYLIWQLSNKWEQYINQKLAPFNISQSEYLHLISVFTLQIKGVEVTQIKIANETGCSLMNTSKTITNLVKKGFVDRTNSQTDKRAKQVEITEKGQQVAMQAATTAFEANNEFFGDYQTKTFLESLQSINNNQ
jgi:DNA-binding MarR family transcriptional regulator